ncbi:MAG: hypothetical protein C6I00_05085 [Nitratiruptor sp.]|nr:hypothetical protein [Nitratiruptor sp.]NPA84285.1 glycosyltransferase [Campylobacterota bacterium]
MDSLRQLEDFAQILNLVDLTRPLPPLGGWAASADYIKRIYQSLQDLLEQFDSIQILECGSGVSTILVGAFLRRYAPNSRLISLEHDHNYFLQTRRELQAHGLTGLVDLHFAPLRPYELEGGIWSWYTLPPLEPDSIHLLLVDGPPMALQPLSRYPALPLLNPFLHQEFQLLLDDGAREEERKVVERWEREYPLRARYEESEKGLFAITPLRPRYRPLVSVAMPTFNRGPLLAQALESLFAQHYENFEVIVVDDGSSQDLEPFIAPYRLDPRFRLIRNDTNRGSGYSRNRCIQEAQGEYILWFDDDDLIHPATLLNYLSLLEELDQEPDVVYGELRFFGSSQGRFQPLDYFKSNGAFQYLILKEPGSPIPNPFTLVRRELYQRVGGYDEEFTRAQDYEFWARVSLEGVVKKFDGFVGSYRVHERNNFGRFDLLSADRSFESLVKRRHLWHLWDRDLLSHRGLVTGFMEGAKKILDYFHFLYYGLHHHDDPPYRELFEIALKMGNFSLARKMAKEARDSTLLSQLAQVQELTSTLLANPKQELLVPLQERFPQSWLTFYLMALLSQDSTQAKSFARGAFLANPFDPRSLELMERLGLGREAQEALDRLVRIETPLEEGKEPFIEEFFHG